MKHLLFFFLSFTSAGLALAQSPSATREKSFTFREQKIRVAAIELTVEVAETPEQHSRGLMFRSKLEEGRGMIFIFPDAEYRGFWMKNTFIPLSIGYFDANKKLVDMQDMEPVKSMMEANPPTYRSKKPAQYALEVPKGWFRKHKIKIGDSLSGL